MTKFGTGASRVLHILLLIGLALMGIGVVGALGLGVLAMFDPEALARSLDLNGRTLYLRQPELSLTLAATVLVACLYMAAVIVQLVGLLRSAAGGMPFVARNVHRLRVLAALFGVVLVVRLFAFLLPATVRDILNMRQGELDVSMILTALFALVLAEVFREGVRLREDAEGTI